MRRMEAVAALVLAAVALVLVVAVAATNFPRGLVAAPVVAAALAGAWEGARRRGALRAVLLVAAGAMTVVVLVSIVAGEPVAVVAGFVALGLSLVAARAAFRVHAHLPPARPPRRPVLFYNPRSGGGKAESFRLPDEARSRGIEPIALTPGADLETLVRDAVAAGADGLAMAGGDGSQATVARLAAELDLPYACIPAGTRNHFALDLGVDRDDVVGALDAFVDGGERVVDLAEVNGRVFVNNVSLGVYAEAVQREGYREAKLRTLLDTVPGTLGPDAAPHPLRWRGPGGEERERAAALLVSNNAYRLAAGIGSGTRPRLDDHTLGVAVLAGGGGPPVPVWETWKVPEFEVGGEGPVPAGIDGEAVVLDPPLRFRTRPAALRVRISPRHPGASPSVLAPDRPWDAVRLLAAIAMGRGPAGPAGPQRRPGGGGRGRDAARDGAQAA